MANKNDDKLLRWNNGGKILVGGSSHNILHVEEGSVSITEGGYENIPVMDRGRFNGDVIAGSERVCTLDLDVRLTRVSLATAGDLRELFSQSVSGGLISTFPVVLQFEDYDGAGTGQQVTFAKCYQAEALNIPTGGPGQPDTMQVRLIDLEAKPTYADY